MLQSKLRWKIVNTDNVIKAEAHEEVVTILVEEEVKITTEEDDTKIETKKIN